MNRRAERYDVVVAGGGTAGVAAAAGAARAGARTLLVERSPYLGGEATHSGVGAFCGFYSCEKRPVKVVSDMGDRVLEALAKVGAPGDDVISAAGNRNINFRPEYLKCALDDLMAEEGVDVLLHTVLVDAEAADGRVTAIRCADDEGCFLVEAGAFVDATGDANLTRLAGGRTMWGGGSGTVQAATMPFRMSGVDTSCDMSPAAVEQAVLQAKREGIPDLTKEKGFILKTEGSDIVTVLLPSAIPQGLSARELTRLERETRRQVLSYVKALKRYMHGMEMAELAVIGPAIGFRETRRMLGREVLQAEDVLARRKRPDGVARGGWKPEIHQDVNKMGVYLEVADGSYFDIPLDVLRAADLENLYGAGRILSADQTAFAAVRVMGTCFATGHAAGVAAAYRSLRGSAEVSDVREELTRQGALV